MGCCKRPPKMPSKTGVSRAEIVAHAFEGRVGSPGRNSRQDGDTIRNDRASASTHSPAVFPAMSGGLN
jgi:hypothetical protein